VPSEQHGLQMGQQADRRCFVEKRVPDLFLLALLLGDDDLLPCFIGHQHGAGLSLTKTLAVDLPAVHQGQCQPVSEERPEFPFS